MAIRPIFEPPSESGTRMIFVDPRVTGPHSSSPVAPSICITAARCPTAMADVSSGSGSALSPENEPQRTVKADPCSLTRAFLVSPELQACGFDTTGATVGN